MTLFKMALKGTSISIHWRGTGTILPPIYPRESGESVVFLCNTMRKFKKVVKISFLGIIEKKSGAKSNFFRRLFNCRIDNKVLTTEQICYNVQIWRFPLRHFKINLV